MSRSGYSDDIDNWDLIRWRGRVASSIRGRRGQAFLRELLTALDAMPVKELVANEFETDGQFCTLGVIGHARGIDMATIDPEDDYHHDELSAAFDIAGCLVQEIEFLNDDDYTYREPAAYRWSRMRAWVAEQIRQEGTSQ